VKGNHHPHCLITLKGGNIHAIDEMRKFIKSYYGL